MDHLPIPESCRDLVVQVPHLRLAPKYDYEGFDLFLERCGLNQERVLSPETLDLEETAFVFGRVNPLAISEQVPMRLEPLPPGWEKIFDLAHNKFFMDHNTHSASLMDPRATPFVESLLQEWLWFGLLHEFELACGVPMDVADLTTLGNDGKTQVLSTKFLASYARSAIIKRLSDEGVPLDLKEGDWDTIRTPESFKGDVSDFLEPLQMTRAIENSNNVVGESPSFSVSELLQESQGPLPEAQQDLPEGGQDAPRDVSLETLLKLLYGVEWSNRQISMIDENETLFPEPESSLSFALLKAREVMRMILYQDIPIIRLEIAISIDVLCDTIEQLQNEIMGKGIRLKASSVSYYSDKFSAQMVARNWCPARLPFMMASELVFRYLASLLPSYDTRSHNECTPEFCSYMQQPPDYCQHLPGCPGGNSICALIDFEESKLVDIWSSGGTPGVRKMSLGKHMDRYDIVDVKGQNFVAISHVWAHGLGNPAKNTLPNCQLRRVFRLIDQIAPPGTHLWLDTLVVPIDEKYKMKAIARLREVYREANKVLVLDSYLAKVGDDWIEQRMQLLSSEWMMRLWTLQEGRLATDLYIQFRNRAVSVAELITNRPTESQFEVHLLTDMVTLTSQPLEPCFRTREGIHEKFVDLVPDLGRRKVTEPRDEAICIATLLGLKLENFHPYPTMKDIFLSMSSWPADLLFVTSPRLTEPGLRWAPSTFLGNDLKSMGLELGTLVKEGLIVSKDCIIFDTPLTLLRSVSGTRGVYEVNCGAKGTFVLEEVYGEAKSEIISVAAIVIMDTGAKDMNLYRGILVSDTVKNGNLTYCRFTMPVYLWRRYAGTEPAISQLLGWEGVESFSVGGEFRPQMKLCID